MAKLFLRFQFSSVFLQRALDYAQPRDAEDGESKRKNPRGERKTNELGVVNYTR